MNNGSNLQVAIPNTQEFCVNIPLYKEYDISQATPEELLELENRSETIDAYCVECNQQSVFQKDTPPMGSPPNLRRGEIRPDPAIRARSDRDFAVSFICSRNKHHQMRFYFRVKDLRISKVGQYPSLADLHLQGIAKYRKVLEPKEYAELARAIGLSAQGIGIGSFVYLRRVFENLIEIAHQKASGVEGWEEGNFQKVRMHEKILLLKEGWFNYGLK